MNSVLFYSIVLMFDCSIVQLLRKLNMEVQKLRLAEQKNNRTTNFLTNPPPLTLPGHYLR
jgi:hypothetical protein